MSKTIIPTIKLLDDECNVLFQSITEKLNINNPKFFYPIYKKVVDDETMSPEDLRCTMLDSKFKCKKILAKLTDSDDEEAYDSDSEDEGKEEGQEEGQILEKAVLSLEDKNNLKPSSELLVGGDAESDNEETQDIDILNPTTNNNDLEGLQHSSDDENYEDDDDAEIEEAINNTYFATAIIERTNKSTGEKICKEEKIHIKKSALLEPLKIMKDEYVILSKVQNQNSSDESLKNTMNKLNSYNNSGHVESLFLYLGNKLVESGRCPSFPYYYGCINGDDPNYHHNITDEYEAVSRTKWFRDRVKTDFDLLIIENDDLENCEDEMLDNVNKTVEDMDKNLENPTLQNKEQDSSSSDSSDSDSSEDEENNKDSNDESECASESESKSKSDNDSDNEHNLDNLIASDDIINQPSLDFIKDMDTEDLEFDINDSTETTETTENTKSINNNETSTDIQDGGCNSDCKVDCCNEHNEHNQDDIDDFIEELSDVDKDNLSIGDYDNNSNNMYYIKCESMPVSLSLMEKLDSTLDDILDEEYNMKETEWFSIFFQVAFGLAVAQKYFSFVHNDLHSSNIMFKKTEVKFLYFQIESIYYKIPTYGKITKIIDFARGTFKFGDRWVFSDQFKEDNDAFGQYDYPVDGTLKNCEHKPNPSFDLVRLGTTVIQRLDELDKVREFVEQITLDDNGTSLCYDEDNFQLYIDIAHNCHNAVPIEVMKRPEFERFKINKNKILKGQYVFKY